MRRLYEPLYRLMALLRIRKEIVFGSAASTIGRVLDRWTPPGDRAIDLGCGVGAESVFLAERGFDVTGVDLSPTAIRLARRRAAQAGAEIDFVVDDLTALERVDGTFDLILDIGTLNDIRGSLRDRYMEQVVPLARPGSLMVLTAFESKLPPGERVARFGPMFDVETIEEVTEPVFRRTMITSLLIRRASGPEGDRWTTAP